LSACATPSIEWTNFFAKHIVDPLAYPRQNSKGASHVMEQKVFKIDEIYVPVKRRKTLELKTVDEIAQSMLEEGQLTPILVRQDGDRLVLVEGLHRMEACKALGETTIEGYMVRARLH